MASEKVTAMIEEIKAMSVLELSELVHEIEDVFGVSAAAAVAAAPVAGAAAAAEEKTEFDVVLTGFGDQKIKVIKAVREITNLGLRKPRRRSRVSPAPSRSRSPRTRPRSSRRSLRKSALLSNSSNRPLHSQKPPCRSARRFFCVWRKTIKVFRQKACSLLRTDFVRRWRTKSTLAA